MNYRSSKRMLFHLLGTALLLSLLAACNVSPTTLPATTSPAKAAATSAPAPTSQPPTAVLPTAVPPTEAPTSTPTNVPPTTGTASFGSVNFAYDLAIAQTVTTTHIAGQNPGSDAPYWAIFPGYDEYNFVGYPSKNTYHKPRIEIYPVAEYEQINPGAKDIIARLKKLLADKPAAPEQLPLLPMFNAAQVFHAQLQYLPFQTGQGVRFVSQYDQAPLPINNLETFYTFQGLTADGKYYITAILPVATGILPDTDQVTPALQAQLGNFPAYLQDEVQKLNALQPQDFTPNLSQLDAVIQTLSVK